ncbi:exodeoxyribonuclease VII large subunit [Mesorhizobium sp. BAC0120]|uniref:exodeoxyribonuclease VII large subunit n=1 Tax=Mesorhizobium sp. BAC0120 TaxID=3090670 RepID=UPI00298CFBD0|nr:exodeoxyribonuclease VII large subunit [Mesorhizobium sp. BAC0120]MDW6025143.1 exodeoxyribonuclease VII large subunit [Mesorhizobium sp. BAC0120]
MSDTLFTDSGRSNATEYTVSEISGALKRAIEDQFGNVRVRGEISGYRGPHSSGHAYFALKDDRARIEAVIWKTTMARLRFRPEEGMEVIASGRLTTYPGSSKYQIVIDNLEPAGAGALMALLEERKRKLAAEGLFEASRKRRLPFMPKVIGVVTSPTGAVIRDILHRIKDRFPVHIIVWPVRVQGDTAGPEATAAVDGFNALAASGAIPRPDVLIVARGGGSLEDLWGFNDEALARAVAASGIPVISAVGHETDWTLVDFVADMRAPTPTGAAEMAVPVKAELEAGLASLGARLRACASRGIDRRRQALRAAARALPSADQLLALPRRRFDEATSRLARGLVVNTERKRARLGAVRLSPAVLTRRVTQGRKDVRALSDRLLAALRAEVRDRRSRFERDARRFDPAVLTRRHQAFRERLGVLQSRGDRSIEVSLERRFSRLVQADRLLSTLSYQAVLERGFAVVSNADGTIVKSAASIFAGERLTLTLADGKANAIATGEAASRTQRTKLSRKGADPDRQGSLF